MALGMRCDTCGADAPSLGSLQMHQLRYHSAPSASSTAGGAAAASAAPTRSGRAGAVVLLTVAITALLSGGAFVATVRLAG
jgi:hypothetical protein